MEQRSTTGTSNPGSSTNEKQHINYSTGTSEYLEPFKRGRSSTEESVRTILNPLVAKILEHLSIT
jgi:hypothetical protein